MSLTAHRSFCLQPEIPFGRLDRDVSQQELNLIEFPAGRWHNRAQVRRRSCGASFSIPACLAAAFTTSQMDLRRHAFSPHATGLIDGAKRPSLCQAGRRRPRVKRWP